MPDTAYTCGIDVGGTFTDCVLMNADTGAIYRAKVLTTNHDQSQGVLSALQAAISQVPIDQNVVLSAVNHGTTIATNAILEQQGARVALLVTEGYRHILQIRRSQVPGGLAGWVVWPKPTPLAPLEMTIEVPGRISSSGEVIRPFDAETMRSRLKQLKETPDAIAVSLINSYASPVHERAVLEVLKAEFPGIPVSLSSDVLPGEMQEYERALTLTCGSYVKPMVSRYLDNMQRQLHDTSLRVLNSDGGLASAHAVKDRCFNILLSGPAGGVAGVISRVAHVTPYKNLLTFDIGGTSTDVCLIQDGKPTFRRESNINDLDIRAPSIDIKTVGAGGGSIANVNSLTKALRVGPQSAGAIPGPACYSKGGKLPTLTDAFCVLGYLPSSLLGGTFPLNVDAARAVIDTHIAQPLGLSVMDAAEGIVKVAIENMCGGLRNVTVQKGIDPRIFNLVPFGGAGGTVSCALAELCGAAYPIIIPPSPGLLCAFGDSITVLRHESSLALVRKLLDLSVDSISMACTDLWGKVSTELIAQGASRTLLSTFEADLRYKGQSTVVSVAFVPAELIKNGHAPLLDGFRTTHERLYTFSLDLDVEIVGVRAIAEESPMQLKTATLPRGNGIPSETAFRGTSNIYIGGQEHTAVPLYERLHLKFGDELPGPCIISETDSTTLIAPSNCGRVDELGNILIFLKDSAATQPEESHTASVDPILLQLIEAGLQNTRHEMDSLIQRCAMSPAMREQLDYFPMIATAAGTMVVGQFGSFIPGFLSSWTDSIEEGDCFITNDPYACNSAISHLNDVLIVRPVYFEGELVSWSANLGHFTDVGSSVPGSMPNGSQSIFSDGLQIPLCKLYSANVPNKAIFKILERNSRKPDFTRSDLQALIAATAIAATRIQALCQRFGPRVYAKALEELLARSKMAVGTLIKTTIPDNAIYFEDYIDDDGFGTGPWKLACTMTKKSDHTVLFDFTGTDPQADYSINFALSQDMLKMFIVSYMLLVYDRSAVINDGSFDLIEVVIPEGTILNPIRPAGLSCRTHALGRVFDIIGALLGQIKPEFLSAAGFSDSPHLFYSGWQGDEWFQLFQIGFGGIPARPHGDGPDGHSLWPSMRSVSNEWIESSFPLRIEKYETVPDSGGPGLYRGGNGMRIHYVFLETGNVSIHDDRWYTKPWGVNGGGVGQRSMKTLVRYSIDNVNPPREILGSKEDFVSVDKDDMLEWVTWGGGGWGNPLERDPELVALEVRQGLVIDTTRYGVELDPSGRVDLTKTVELRQSMKDAQTVVSSEIFNRGGTLKSLRAACLKETGKPPPTPPSARVLRGPVTRHPNIVALHEQRAVEDSILYGE